MSNAQNDPAVLGPVQRQVRPGAEARHLPTPEDLRNYANDADQHGNHWVPIAPASLRGMADEFERMRGALLLAQRLCNEALPKFNWGASCLDANAIKILNDAPLAVTRALGPNVEANRPPTARGAT